MSRALEQSQKYTTNHNCFTIACIRELPLDSLLDGAADRVEGDGIWCVTALNAAYPLIFKPVLDNYVLPEKYVEQMPQGPANDVPLITGGTKDETGANPQNTYTVEEVNYWQGLKFGNLSDEYFSLYPTGNTSTLANQVWNSQTRDEGLISQWAYAREWVKTSNATSPIWTYYWGHAPAGQDAFHQSEIKYALNALYAKTDDYPFTEYDWYAQSMISAYWANFAKTGNPNAGGSYKNASGELPCWAPQDGTTQFTMRLGDGFENNTAKIFHNHSILFNE